MNFENRKPEINYPCNWDYKVIGEDADKLIEAIEDSVGTLKHRISTSNVSSGGKYISLNLTVAVPNELARDLVFQRLSEHEDIRWVI
jgi:hypothetical protein